MTLPLVDPPKEIEPELAVSAGRLDELDDELEDELDVELDNDDEVTEPEELEVVLVPLSEAMATVSRAAVVVATAEPEDVATLATETPPPPLAGEEMEELEKAEPLAVPFATAVGAAVKAAVFVGVLITSCRRPCRRSTTLSSGTPASIERGTRNIRLVFARCLNSASGADHATPSTVMPAAARSASSEDHSVREGPAMAEGRRARAHSAVRGTSILEGEEKVKSLLGELAAEEGLEWAPGVSKGMQDCQSPLQGRKD